MLVVVVPMAENRSLILPSTVGEISKDIESALFFETLIVFESPICTASPDVTSSAETDTNISWSFK